MLHVSIPIIEVVEGDPVSPPLKVLHRAGGMHSIPIEEAAAAEALGDV